MTLVTRAPLKFGRPTRGRRLRVDVPDEVPLQRLGGTALGLSQAIDLRKRAGTAQLVHVWAPYGPR